MTDKKKIIEQLRDESRERTLGFIIGGFSVVAGLAWNEAIRGLLEYIFPATRNTIVAKFGYAAIMTAILVLATLILNRLLQRKTPGA